VIGRSFYYSVLKGVDDNREVDRHLNTLQRVDLIRESARQPEIEFTFRHELTRDAAYKSILRRQRRDYHRRVGEAMETLFQDRIERESHRLAYHFQEAHQHPKALQYTTLAGDTSARLYANQEAITHYSRALALAERVPISNEHLIHLYTRRGRIFEVCGQYEDALANYQELEKLGQDRKSTDLRIAALLPQATIYSTPTAKFNPEHGDEIASRALNLARETGNQEGEARALWNLMLSESFTGGDILQGVNYGEEALAIARKHDMKEVLAYVLHDLATSYLSLGKAGKAWAALAESQDLWRELHNLPMLADNLTMSAGGHFLIGQFDEAIKLIRESLAISKKTGSLWGQAYSLNTLTPVLLEKGEFSRAIQILHNAIELAEQANFANPRVSARSVLAYIYTYLGDIRRGEKCAQEALAISKQSHQSSIPPLLAYSKIHLTRGDPEKAKSQMRKISDRTNLDAASIVSPYGLVASLEGEIALACEEYDRALRFADRSIVSMENISVKAYLADVMLVKGKALAKIGQFEMAVEVLEKALNVSETIGSRRIQWQILSTMADIEEQMGAGESVRDHRRQAKEVILLIAGRIEDPELRKSFGSTPDVRKNLNFADRSGMVP
jgi:tetratricopeptide (TPR) repeat protein